MWRLSLGVFLPVRRWQAAEFFHRRLPGASSTVPPPPPPRHLHRASSSVPWPRCPQSRVSAWWPPAQVAFSRDWHPGPLRRAPSLPPRRRLLHVSSSASAVPPPPHLPPPRPGPGDLNLGFWRGETAGLGRLPHPPVSSPAPSFHSLPHPLVEKYALDLRSISRRCNRCNRHP
jgi:hypothetical protein